VSLVLVAVALAAPASAPAAESAGEFGWAVDGSTGFSGLPTPLGPNVSATVDGSLRIEISGAGDFAPEQRTVTGGGSYRVLTAAGTQVGSGDWSMTGYLGYDDSGPLLLPAVPFRTGLLSALVHLEGAGSGRIDVYCHVPPEEVEGVRIFLPGRSFEVIEQGSTTIERH
jgi:hypothetical protein